MSADVDVAVIGGGVVGLSVAYEAVRSGYTAAVLERHSRMGEETSTHNSGVLHAGIYYPEKSLKAGLCVRGRSVLVNRLEQWKVPFRLCGKIIVASDETERPKLEELCRLGSANGVEGLRLITSGEIKNIEPNVRGVAALYSPATGVFDVSEYLRSLEARTQNGGGLIINNACVIAVERFGEMLKVRTGERGDVIARTVVNSAGLFADEVARFCGDERHRIFPCRGEYAVVVPKKAHLIRGLVYPVPSPLGLGVHLTKTMGGELWLGPDAKFIESKTDYEKSRRNPDDFFEEAHRLCPGIAKEDLRMGPSGIRPKRGGPAEPKADFFIEKQPDDPRIVHLIGIESPGLTASAAIAERVIKMVAKIISPCRKK